MKFLMSMIVAFFVACTPTPVNPTPDADASAIDASPTPFGTYDCESWCYHATVLSCSAAATTEHGATCIEVCKNTLDGPVPFNVQCRTLASSCAQADLCENDLLQAKVAPATCAAWCAHAQALKCPAAQRTPKGAPCTDVCNNVMTGPARFNLRCRVSARTCALADGCEK